MDEKLEKWLKWMNIIHEEVRTLYTNQSIFYELGDIVRHNTSLHKPNLLYNYLNDSYVAYIIMGIRRLVDKGNNDTISLYRVLRELSETPEVLSREKYITFYKNTVHPELADSSFDIFCDNKGDKHISSQLVKDDLEKLENIYDSIKHVGDKRIAHRDKQVELKSLPTHEDLKSHMQALYRLYKHYYSMFYASELCTVSVSSSWKKVLEVPWVK